MAKLGRGTDFYSTLGEITEVFVREDMENSLAVRSIASQLDQKIKPHCVLDLSHCDYKLMHSKEQL